MISTEGCNPTRQSYNEVNLGRGLTDVTPYLQHEIIDGKNLIYCATFQLAWNEMKNNVVKEDIHIKDETPSVKNLNSSKVSKNDLSDKYYVALVGSGKENIVEKINGELKQKFTDSPEVLDKVLPDDFFAYAYLSKKLEFRKEFEAFDKPITFKGCEVQSFGIDQKKDSLLLSQVEVIDYKDDNNFIVRIMSKQDEDMLVLAKVSPQDDLGKTYQAITNRIKTTVPLRMQENDRLIVPMLNFSVTKSYDELLRKPLTNKGWQEYFFSQAIQSIKRVSKTSAATTYNTAFKGYYIGSLVNGNSPNSKTYQYYSISYDIFTFQLQNGTT